jgi:hypothetical protein
MPREMNASQQLMHWIYDRLSISHWVDGLLLGFSSDGQKSIGDYIFTLDIISLSDIGSRA